MRGSVQPGVWGLVCLLFLLVLIACFALFTRIGPAAAASCCETGSSPGCDESNCSSQVCCVAEHCCEETYDLACALLAQSICATCGGDSPVGSVPESCCSAHPGGGCIDAPCEAAVCYGSPECCSGDWTPICAQRAADLCFACGPSNCSVGGAESDPEPEIPETSCTSNSECAFLSSDCSVGMCSSATGHCELVGTTGQECDDGDPCTLEDSCLAGVCTAGSEQKDCDDDEPCTEDSCLTDTGGCIHQAGPILPCDDGLLCTAGDFCDDGACTGTPTCDDGVPCTVDMCDPSSGDCTFVPNCPDGEPCTISFCSTATGACEFEPEECPDAGLCELGVCNLITGDCETEPPDCDDGDSCTTDVCNPDTGECEHGANCGDGGDCFETACDPSTGDCTITIKPEGTPCDDGRACTVNDICLATLDSQCTGESICNDFLDCTVDICAESGECVFTSVCDEDGPCPEECDPNIGVCVLEPLNCPDDGPCNVGLCDAAAGGCTTKPKDCSDNDACTTDSCGPTTGVCFHVSVSCFDGEQCTVDSCNSATGECVSTPDVAGSFCVDGLDCTENDACNGAGQCVGADTCDDGHACTSDSCDPSSKDCVFEPDASLCDDGNPCTIDTCAPKFGCLHLPVFCPQDSDPCTVNACDLSTGECVASPADFGTPCDDLNLCTDNDICLGEGECEGAAKCSDEFDCTEDSCDPATGDCTHVPDSTLCDDEDPCTVDTCTTGFGCINIVDVCPTPIETVCGEVKGDWNADAQTNIVDVQCGITMTLWFLGEASPLSQPPCFKGPTLGAADLDCGGSIGVEDIQLTIAYTLGAKLAPAIDANDDQCPDACE